MADIAMFGGSVPAPPELPASFMLPSGYGPVPPPRPGFWARRSTWLVIAAVTLTLTCLYFVVSATGGFAGASGGCGGG